MMQLTDEQKGLLGAPLSTEVVKKRQGKFLYVEAWYCIDVMNKIFGFGQWSHEIHRLENVSQVNVNDKEGKAARFNVSFLSESIVRVGNATYRDTGTGHGQNMPLGDAIESASKEAVSDSMKRTMRHLGYQFGLALYDKEFANVVRPDDEQTSETPEMSGDLSSSAGVESTSQGQPAPSFRGDVLVYNPEAGTPQGQSATGGFKRFLAACQEQKFRIGMENYYHALGLNGFERSNQIFDVTNQKTVFTEFQNCPSIPFLDHLNQIRRAFDDMEKTEIFDRWMDMLNLKPKDIPEDREIQVLEGLYDTLSTVKRKAKK